MTAHATTLLEDPAAAARSRRLRPARGTIIAPADAIAGHEPVTIIHVGPPPTATGGVSTVVEAIVGLDLAPRYRIEFLPTTHRDGPRESLRRRWLRHARKAGELHRMFRIGRADHGRRNGGRVRPRILHLHTCSGFSFWRSLIDLEIGRRSGCRTALHIHGARFDEFYHAQPAPLRALIRTSLRRASVVIALSPDWAQRLRHISPRANVAVIENAIAVPAPRTTPRSPGPCRFLTLCRMDAWKGIDDLLDACLTLVEGGAAFELVLAGPPGSAGDASMLRRKIAARGVQHCVTYVGELRGHKRDARLDWADVLVQPSHQEGMPMSVLEGMARGLAVVATSVGALPEVITPGVHGLLVAPRDPVALAHALRNTIDDPDQRRTLGQNARDLIRTRFHPDRYRRDLLALYDGLIARVAASPSAVSPQVPHGRTPKAADR